MPHTAFHTTDISAEGEAGASLAGIAGGLERAALSRGMMAAQEFSREREAALKRQEERAKKRQRLAEVISVLGTVAGAVVGGPLLSGGLAGALGGVVSVVSLGVA